MTELSRIEMLRLADEYVARTTPVVVVPQAEPLAQLDGIGHRFLAAQDGMHVEFRRAWCHGIQQVAPSALQLPFGLVKPSFKTTCGRPPQWLYEQFIAMARRALPNEVAAWFVWDERVSAEQAWSLVELSPISSSSNHIEFERVALEPGQHVVVDIHSHGRAKAFFSSTDDRNDAELRDVKISVVIGHLDRPVVSSVQRLCVLGAFINNGACHEIQSAQ